MSLRSNHSGALGSGRGREGLAGTALARKAGTNEHLRPISTVHTNATFLIALSMGTYSKGTETEIGSQRGVCQCWGMTANTP